MDLHLVTVVVEGLDVESKRVSFMRRQRDGDEGGRLVLDDDNLIPVTVWFDRPSLRMTALLPMCCPSTFDTCPCASRAPRIVLVTLVVTPATGQAARPRPLAVLTCLGRHWFTCCLRNSNRTRHPFRPAGLSMRQGGRGRCRKIYIKDQIN